MMQDALSRLEAWYAAQCDGTWEHQHGVRIETIDNPGWRVEINLTGTPLQGQVLDDTAVDRSETDWLRYRVRDGQFEGFGGARNLNELLHTFLVWAGR